MIKNIIYLDEAKMYSMSSQIFEGVTEYVLKEVSSSLENSEDQKGPVGSGKVLADVMRLAERAVEKRFLHDHSLSLFESRLVELDLVIQVPGASAAEESINKSFVRIDAQANFMDAAKIVSMLGSFNEVGEAIGHVTRYSEFDGKRKEIEAKVRDLRDKAKIAALREEERKFTDTAENAKQHGLYQDPKFLKHLAMVMEFGFSGQLEVQQRVGERFFSSCLKRECLREADDLVIRKYSRMTERNLVVLGVVTQSKQVAGEKNTAALPKNMKEAVTGLANQIGVIEESIFGKSPHEVVVDPIAVYVEL